MPTETFEQEMIRHWVNMIHHANTKAFTNAFFPALGYSFGLMPLVLVLGFFL